MNVHVVVVATRQGHALAANLFKGNKVAVYMCMLLNDKCFNCSWCTKVPFS